MFAVNKFKGFFTPQKEVTVLDRPIKSSTKRSTKEIVEEIHDTFYTEVDKILASASIANSLHSDKQGLVDKCARLKALGFKGTKEVLEAEREIRRLNTLEYENQQKTLLLEAINHFSFKYPQYKFITEDSVKKICQKYGLIYATVDRFIGEVPEKNLKHIEQFKIQPEDECYVYYDYWRNDVDPKNILSYEKAKNYEKSESEFSMQTMRQYRIPKVCKLEIAAPLTDFETTGMKLEDFKLVNDTPPDPIVLKPVFYGGKKFYLIVTAWGAEASDVAVVNEKMN